MAKAGRWLKGFLTCKREEKGKGETLTSSSPTEAQSDPIPVPTPNEKKRWSFRRQAAEWKGLTCPDQTVSAPTNALSEAEIDQKRHAMKAEGVAVAAAQTAADVMSLTSTTTGLTSSAIEEAAAIKIQAIFRSYLVLPVLLSPL